jgi:PAB1-binding protein PBP1
MKTDVQISGAQEPKGERSLQKWSGEGEQATRGLKKAEFGAMLP